MSMATKPDKVVTYNKELPSIESQGSLISRPPKVKWEIKYIISSLPPSLWSLNLTRVVSYYKELSRIKSHNPLNTSSNEVTLQIKYIASQLPQDPWPLNASRRWLTMRDFHLKSQQPFKCVVFWDHGTNRKRFTSNTAMSEATKVISMVT